MQVPMKPGVLLVLAALLLFRASAPAEEISSAAGVADRIGQTVEFQDEVKAVSWSRSTNGYYLSFGAPYPKQVLSVWVDEKLYNKLPEHRTLLGRTVEIKGELEKSPSGPLLKLQAVENFVLLPADETILAKPRVDGKQEGAQIIAAGFPTFSPGGFENVGALR